MMSAIIHNFKHLFKITKEDTVILDKNILKDELVSLLENKPGDKILFYRYGEK